MSFSVEQENRIRKIVDEQLEAFLKYQLSAFQPVGKSGDSPRPTQPQVASASSPIPSPPASLAHLKWEEMPKTASNKGTWQRCIQLSNPEVQAIIDKVEAQDIPVFLDGYLYWVNYTDDVAVSIGRRKT